MVYSPRILALTPGRNTLVSVAPFTPVESISVKASYDPQRSWGKVMFLHVSVILFTGGGCLSHCMLGYSPGTRHPPQTRHPQSRQPLGADTPPSAVHAGRYRQQASGTHPTGMQSCVEIELGSGRIHKHQCSV